MQIFDIQFSDETSFQDWLVSYCGHEVFNPGLERISCAIDSIHGKLNVKKIITIAGTNGKGQCSQLVSGYLTQKQVNHTLWTSPHIHSIRERFAFNGKLISFDELIRFSKIVVEIIERKKIGLSYYEFLFAIFCFWSDGLNIDVIVLEVGLGGRLDAVNVFDANAVCIPSIARDHCEVLGNRYEQILFEKLGVTRSGQKLFTCFNLKYLRNKTEDYCQKKKVEFFDLVHHKIINKSQNFDEKNRALVAMCCSKVFHEDYHSILSLLSDMIDYRRIKLIKNNAHLELYGSHNLDGIRNLIQFLKQRDYNNIHIKRVIFAFSKRPLAEIKSILKLISNSFSRDVQLNWTEFTHAKSLRVTHEYLELLKEFSGKINYFEDWKSCLQNLPSDKQTIVLGSYYFIDSVFQYSSKQGFSTV